MSVKLAFRPKEVGSGWEGAQQPHFHWGPETKDEILENQESLDTTAEDREAHVEQAAISAK